jgi:DNA-directed RNA polymerase specialized sigma24 family protein
MQSTNTLKVNEITAKEWQKTTSQQLEETADQLLSESENGQRTYTERALARKIRLEERHLPEMNETAMPGPAIDYIQRRQMALLVDSARLTRPQAAVLTLALQGWDPCEIADEFSLPYEKVIRQLRIARARVENGGSPYDGLYEVYWREVHRYVYRKGR